MDLPTGLHDAVKEKTDQALKLQLRLPNGVWIRKNFALAPLAPHLCDIHDHGEQYLAESTHRCPSRHRLWQSVVALVPGLVPSENLCWFATLNKESNTTAACLFDGAKLELKLAPPRVPEFGICFQRASFVRERGSVDVESLVYSRSEAADWQGWRWREPSDSDRLLVNKRGREVLYFLQPPPTQYDLTLTDLRAEVCCTMKIAQVERVAFAAGPFYWGPDFTEDGLGLYNTYFNDDIIVGGQHMKTKRGAALIDVTEVEFDWNSP